MRGLRGRLASFAFCVVGAWALAGASPQVLAADVDPATCLIENPGWELVRAQCGSCHSYGLITNQRGDRETWLSIIRWMQETQNLWDLGVDVETAILDYLADNYPPPRNFRRPPIPEHLMPSPAEP